jgi:phage terminase small subunit
MRKTVIKEKKSKLTLKQKTFVDEYLIDCNATQAAISADYSPKTANRTASETCQNLTFNKQLNLPNRKEQYAQKLTQIMCYNRSTNF